MQRKFGRDGSGSSRRHVKKIEAYELGYASKYYRLLILDLIHKDARPLGTDGTEVNGVCTIYSSHTWATCAWTLIPELLLLMP